MAFVGGIVKEISYNHPDLGSGFFYPKSGEDATIDTGGFVSEDDAQSIAANGAMIDKMQPKRWKATATIAADFNTNEELEKLQALANSTKEATWTIAHISGAVYSGKGKPVGDLSANLSNATIAITLAGGGKLAKIS